MEMENEPRCSNMESGNPIFLDEGNKEKLKGDAIGNTLYSESGLLKTLILLSQFKEESWSEQMEEQLCLLWDMTFEEDVVAVLMEHDFVNLACQVIQVTSEPRLIEILVGILGNMTSLKNVRLSLSQSNSAKLLLSLLSSSDTLTLLQLIRLLNSCVWHVNKSSRLCASQNEDEHSEQEAEVESWVRVLTNGAGALTEYLSFILKSSTNEELLQSTLELLNNLCCLTNKNHHFSEFLSSSEMLLGLSEALHQLLNSEAETEANTVWEEKSEKASLHWSQTLSSFTLHDTGIDLIYEQRQLIMRSMCSILDPFCLQENIFPLNSRKLEILDSMTDVLECLKRRHNYSPPPILPRMLTLLSFLSPIDESQGDDRSSIEELENEGDLEKHAEILRRICDYCLSTLCETGAQDFYEAFGENPKPKIESLFFGLSKCLGSDVQKIVKIMQELNK